MLDTRLRVKYKELQKQVKVWLKYVRWENWILFSVLIVWLVLALTSEFMDIPLLAPDTYSIKQLIPMSLFGLYLIITVCALALVARKKRLYRPNADNLLLYYVCSIFENLEDYHKRMIPELKEEYRKKAVKSGRELLSIVRKDWTLGDFGLAKNIFEDAISNISYNLRNRILPNLKRGDDETLKKVEFSLYQFAQYLLNPHLDTLQNVNTSMSKSLDSYEIPKLGRFARCSLFFATHTVLKHIVVVVSIFAFSLISALFGIYYGHISIDTAFIGFATIFSALIVGYFAYVSKK